MDLLESRCLLSSYDVLLNSPYEAGTSIAGESQSYTDIADFQATDPNGNAVTDSTGFTATINWGDGTSSMGSIEDYPGAPGLFEIDGDHAYPNPSNGEYNIQVVLTDPDGGEWYVRQWGEEGEQWDLFCLNPANSPLTAVEALGAEIALAAKLDTGSG